MNYNLNPPTIIEVLVVILTISLIIGVVCKITYNAGYISGQGDYSKGIIKYRWITNNSPVITLEKINNK